jgi:hypothetical protein
MVREPHEVLLGPFELLAASPQWRGRSAPTAQAGANAMECLVWTSQYGLGRGGLNVKLVQITIPALN